MQLTEQVQHDLLVFLIQIAGRFVGENQLRAVDQRTGDAHALLLAAGKLPWQMVCAIFQSYAFQRLQGLLLIDYGMIVLRDHHVLRSRQMRHEIEFLEHEPDHVLAHVGELLGIQILKFAAFKHHGALGRRIHAADHVHQRGLAGTGRADDRQPFAFRHGQIQVVDGMQVAVDLGDVVKLKQDVFGAHDYSSLKTMAGSIRVARRTGGMDATTAISMLNTSDARPNSQLKPMARSNTVTHSTRASA